MPFTFTPLRIPDVVRVDARTFGDGRGIFREMWKASEFAANGLDLTFKQDNHSRSTRGVVRGLHFQKPPRAQGKYVYVLNGEILDVVVDIRRGSPTFGQHVSEVLSADNGRGLWVPPGFAHGFAVLSDVAHLYYKCTDEYSAAHETGILWNDPDVAIDWRVDAPVLSPRDEQLPRLKDIDSGFVYGSGI
jgi:dTDP-4-dehydrorhamnose 3,5-epimerase